MTEIASYFAVMVLNQDGNILKQDMIVLLSHLEGSKSILTESDYFVK